MRVLTIGILPALCFLSAGFAQAEEIIPDTDQTTLLRGTARVSDGIRAVTGETDATGHGPITYYNVPFDEGTFSLSWKVEKEPRDGCRPPQWGVTGSQKHHCHRSHDPACIEVQDEVGKRWHIGGETPAWRSIFISILIV